ncbi:MAG: hypothetical protein HRU15_05665 [Planctomycetes bacterium]|nr:hypothetical protein [Planctomycetota bacterium]
MTLPKDNPLHDKHEGSAAISVGITLTEGEASLLQIPAFRIGGASIIVGLRHPNPFMFCCNIAKEPVGSKSFANKLGYDSCYLINNPENFARCIANHIKLHLSNDDIASPTRKKFPDNYILTDYRIEYKHGPIKYTADKVLKIDQDNRHQIFGIASKMRSLDKLFTKEQLYSDQEEYRFIFQVVHKNWGLLDVEPNYFDLEVSNDKDLFSSKPLW